MSFRDYELDDLPLAEVLGSLSYALDLTTGQPLGHSQASCLIALRIATHLRLSDDLKSSLYHAMLIKDSGCSSNAARIYQIFGSDERAAKRKSKIVDWTNLFEAAKYAAEHALPDAGILRRAGRLLQLATKTAETSRDWIETRCNRGADIALTIGLGENAAECIRTLDEHWDGQGQPYGLKGDRIPLLGRIACLAQTMEVFARTFGVNEAYSVIRQRSGKWFDPELVRIATTFKDDMIFWRDVLDAPRESLLRLEVRAILDRATRQRIDTICEVFAQVVDAKSPFTAEHSRRVTQYAVDLGAAFGFTDERLATLRRASLLHDIGKLAVSNAILDKPGKPTDEEWKAIRSHPYYTEQILKTIPGFQRICDIAKAHHERLDGKGYFMGMTANELDADMRVLAVADVFDAISADRPYRAAMDRSQVYAILDRDAGLDQDCVATVKDLYGFAPLPALGHHTEPMRLAA